MKAIDKKKLKSLAGFGILLGFFVKTTPTAVGYWAFLFQPYP